MATEFQPIYVDQDVVLPYKDGQIIVSLVDAGSWEKGVYVDFEGTRQKLVTQGPVGPPGPEGPRGQQGLPGTSGLKQLTDIQPFGIGSVPENATMLCVNFWIKYKTDDNRRHVTCWYSKCACLQYAPISIAQSDIQYFGAICGYLVGSSLFFSNYGPVESYIYGGEGAGSMDRHKLTYTANAGEMVQYEFAVRDAFWI